MSINRDMEIYSLQKVVVERTKSGAEKSVWTRVGEIQVAVYKKDEMKVYTSELYVEATHTGLTRCRTVSVKDCRLVKGDRIYLVEACNTEGRLTNLILKEVV